MLSHYGDDTTLAPAITGMNITATLLPRAGKVHFDLDFTVVSHIQRTIEATLRLQLPSSTATVCDLAVDGEGAVAVPKAQASKIAYEEREKGKAVTNSEAVQGGMWQTTLYPLHFNTEVKVHIGVVCDLTLTEDDKTLEVRLPTPGSDPSIIQNFKVHVADGKSDEGTTPAVEWHIDPTVITIRAHAPSKASCTARMLHSDRLVWSGHVSRCQVEQLFAPVAHNPSRQPSKSHVVLIVDSSRSSHFLRESTKSLISHLGNRNESLTFSLVALSRVIKLLGTGMQTEEMLSKMTALRYDGGTDLSLLASIGDVGLELGSSSMVIFVSDGLHNLSTAPLELAREEACRKMEGVAIHVALPATMCSGAQCREQSLRWIAHQTGGMCVSLGQPDHAAEELLACDATTIYLTRVLMNKGDDMEVFEDDSGFVTQPDFRLNRLSVRVGKDGCSFGGSVDTSKYSLPTEMKLCFHRNSEQSDLTVPIVVESDADGHASSLIARALEVSDTLQRIDEAVMTHPCPDETKAYCTQLALECRIACEYTSLLRLNEATQFCDHGISCPKSHPAHDEWRRLVVQHEAEREARESALQARIQDKLKDSILPLCARYSKLIDGSVLANRPHFEFENRGLTSGPAHLSPMYSTSGVLVGDDDGMDDDAPVYRGLTSSSEPTYRSLSSSSIVQNSNASAVQKPDQEHAPAPKRARVGQEASVPTAPLAPPVSAGQVWQTAMRDLAKEGKVAEALNVFYTHLETCTLLTPSIFILASQSLHEGGVDARTCADMLFNVLEIVPADTQTFRVVAYHLVSFGCFDEAVAILTRIRDELAPSEPHSFIDLALVTMHQLRVHMQDTDDDDVVRLVERIVADMERVVDCLLHVILGVDWAKRFREIEWPVLILLSWSVAWADHHLARLTGSADRRSLWPDDRLPSETYRFGGASGPKMDAFVWMGWDTDHTDIDLHVYEPTKEHVYFSNSVSRSTHAMISKDFTDGYGPEVYTLPCAPPGEYKIAANYFASHQASMTTGATSVILWSVTRMGSFDEEKVEFASVRLQSDRQQHTVMSLCL